MSAVADPLSTGPGRGGSLRWLVSLVAVLVAHLGLAAVLYDWRAHPPLEPVVAPVVLLDLEPLPAPPPPPEPVVLPEPPPPPPPPPPEPVIQPEPPPPIPLPEPIPEPVEEPVVALPPPPKPKPKPPVKPPEPKPIEQPPAPSPPPVASSPKPPEPSPPAPPQPARPATVPPSVQAAYLGRLSAAVQQNMRLPGAARFSRDRRTVDVRFTVDRTGKLLALKIDKTSGRDLFDDEALEAFRRTKLPPFPEDLPSDQLQVVITLNFTYR